MTLGTAVILLVLAVAGIVLIMMIHHAFAATMASRIHQLGILQGVGLCLAVFGIYGEMARKSLFVRRKAMRVGTMSIFLAVFACISILNILGVSGFSTERTYFDRYKNNWDFLVTVKGETYSEDLQYESCRNNQR